MKQLLTGKTAIVTGASKGIGLAIAELYAEEGANVVMTARGKDALEDAVATINARDGGRALAVVADSADPEAPARVFKEAIDAFGQVDILVNNAGWDVVKPFLDSDAEHWKKLIDINLYGPLNMHHAVLPGMVENGKGRVVNIASDAGRVGSSGESVYAACKGGIIAFTKTVARELARKGIQLNAVAPGPTDTPILAQFAQGDSGTKIAEGLKRAIPMKRLGQPSDYPGIICFLASDDAGFITGQVITVDGGRGLVS